MLLSDIVKLWERIRFSVRSGNLTFEELYQEIARTDRIEHDIEKPYRKPLKPAAPKYRKVTVYMNAQAFEAEQILDPGPSPCSSTACQYVLVQTWVPETWIEDNKVTPHHFKNNVFKEESKTRHNLKLIENKVKNSFISRTEVVALLQRVARGESQVSFIKRTSNISVEFEIDGYTLEIIFNSDDEPSQISSIYSGKRHGNYDNWVSESSNDPLMSLTYDEYKTYSGSNPGS